MSDPESCLAKAREAEQLAEVVSYGRDRERLIEEARSWRARAMELEAADPPPGETDAESGPAAWLRRCARTLLGSHRRRGG